MRVLFITVVFAVLAISSFMAQADIKDDVLPIVPCDTDSDCMQKNPHIEFSLISHVWYDHHTHEGHDGTSNNWNRGYQYNG
jgi:hypothetical protein